MCILPQLLYGEDGLDVTGLSYMNKFAFLASNAQRFAQQLDLEGALKLSKVKPGQSPTPWPIWMIMGTPSTSRVAPANQVAGLQKEEKKVRDFLSKRADLLSASVAKDSSEESRAKASTKLRSQLPLMAAFPTTALGATSESFGDSLLAFVEGNPDGVLQRLPPPVDDDDKKAKKKANAVAAAMALDATKRRPGMRPEVEAETFVRLMQLKFMRTQVAAGEAVGVLAAQSVGKRAVPAASTAND